MTNKTVIDLMRSYIAVSDMCDAYNKEQGTDVKPWDCVRNKRFPFSLRTKTHPDFNGLTDDCLQSMEFVVSILEGKPVFVGDELYEISTGKKCIVQENGTVRSVDGSVGYSVSSINSYMSFTAQKPNHTFTINQTALNEAGWAFIESLRNTTGVAESPLIFNKTKEIITPVILKYLEEEARDKP